jgi:unsaturated rhamnogalacturonyl hydrolase
MSKTRRTGQVLLLLLVLSPFWCGSNASADGGVPAEQWLAGAVEAVPGSVLSACGVTRRERPMPVLLGPGMLDLNSDRCRVLIVTGFESHPATIQSCVGAWRQFHTDAGFSEARQRVALGIVPIANPDGLADGLGDQNSEGDQPGVGYPPGGTAYGDARRAEAIYLWRWIGMLAPDLVVVVRPGNALVWRASEAMLDVEPGLTKAVRAQTGHSSMGLADALAGGSPGDVAAVPALEVTAPDGGFLKNLIDSLTGLKTLPRSAARVELLRRQARSPVEVATGLSQFYGHDLSSVAYIPALALVGRVRLGDLTDDERHLQDVLKIVKPYADGRSSLGDRPSGSTLSGHLIFGELARRTGLSNAEQSRFVELTQVAADLGFNKQGQPLNSMPFHSEMSDAVFMGTPILVQAGRLTGETKYFEMAARHLKFMLNLNLRDDGLHQHSPVDPAKTAWGRGNGFPALGVALSLSDLPEDSPHRPLFLKTVRNHLSAMLAHQDEMGMWHQVVDHPESYREFTVTCMTTFAMTRGMREGGLDRDQFRPAVQRAWQAIKTRIGPEGRLVDVCTGTGKQKSLREYFDRTAILGRDSRGGAMALMVSTEVASAIRDGVLAP